MGFDYFYGRGTEQFAFYQVPVDVVKTQFMKIDSGHMEYILDCFKNQITDIRNVKQYLLATIYNAPLTIDHYYTAKVSYDMAHWKETV